MPSFQTACFKKNQTTILAVFLVLKQMNWFSRKGNGMLIANVWLVESIGLLKQSLRQDWMMADT